MDLRGELTAPVRVHLAALAAEFDALLGEAESGGLDHLDDGDLLRFWQRFEVLGNRLPVVEHRLVREAEARDLRGQYCRPSVARLVAQTLRVSAGEAARRVRAAEQLGERMSMLGEPVAPVRPVLAAAQRAGRISPDQVDRVLVGLKKGSSD